MELKILQKYTTLIADVPTHAAPLAEAFFAVQKASVCRPGALGLSR